jgi:hypothetical protein
MIGDRRAPDAPPCDSLAEGIVLHHLLIHPELIGTVDLAPLLVFPEHVWCWQAMVRTRAGRPDLDCGDFWKPWLAELEQLAPGKSLNLWDLLSRAAGDDMAARRWQCVKRYGTVLGVMAEHDHHYYWWLARLRSIAEARQGIAAAQRIAEGFWRIPDGDFSGSDALAILHRAVQRRPIRVDV